MSFTKVHQSILQSSLWCEDSDTKVVWITMLALADKLRGVLREYGLAVGKAAAVTG